jgi:hypothetical protein
MPNQYIRIRRYPAVESGQLLRLYPPGAFDSIRERIRKIQDDMKWSNKEVPPCSLELPDHADHTYRG